MSHQEIVTKALDGTLYRQIKFEYDVDDDVIYIGKHRNPNAAITDTHWVILKYIYDGSKNLIDIQVAIGAWSLRTSYF